MKIFFTNYVESKFVRTVCGIGLTVILSLQYHRLRRTVLRDKKFRLTRRLKAIQFFRATAG
jgi:hypothetical protein